MQHMIAQLKDASAFAAEADGRTSPTVKSIQTQIKRLEKKLHAKADKRAKAAKEGKVYDSITFDLNRRHTVLGRVLNINSDAVQCDKISIYN